MASTGVLFVCLGNICRSTMAEAMFQHLVDARGLTEGFRVESAGTGDYHVGERSHPRTREVLGRYGIEHRSLARQVDPADFEAFDLLLAMDRANERDLHRLLRDTGGSDAHTDKIRLVLEPVGGGEVPDPYWGTIDDYVRNYQLLLPALEAWLDRLEQRGR